MALTNGEIVKSMLKVSGNQKLALFVLILAVYVPEKIFFMPSSPTSVGFFVCGMMGRLYKCNGGLIMLNTTTHNIDGKEIKEYFLL